MKRNIIIIVGVISFIADIITLTPILRKILINWCGLNIEKADIINNATLIIATFLLVISFVLFYRFVSSKLIDAGTHEIACAIVPYVRFKIINKTNKLLKLLHSHVYHVYANSKTSIVSLKRQRNQNRQNTPLPINDVKPQISNLLREFYRILYETFQLDLSISFYLSERENGNTVLTRCLFIQSLKEQNWGEMRQMNRKYIIQANEEQSLKSYVLDAKEYVRHHPNSSYKKNSVFDYVLTTNNASWMSNDLRIDEKNDFFYSTSRYYKHRYKSMAVFAIVPPDNGNNPNNPIKGLLTFDSFRTRLFSEKECTMLMGLMAHQLYELLDSLN